MCRACRETPDGQGRRCPRDDGFTSTEAEQRNRSRGLTNVSSALARGDVQAAANHLANARRAQQELDGPTPPPEGAPGDTTTPHRDLIISPSDITAAKAQIEQLNQQRSASGQSPLDVDITRQTRPDENDPIMTWERITARVSGATNEDLQGFDLTKVAAEPEKRADTEAVLAATAAITRIESNGEYVPRNEGGDRSTPALVIQYVNDAPNGPLRQRYAPQRSDVEQAQAIRGWVRTVQPTNDYMQAVRGAVGQDQLGPRDVGTAASAFAAYNRSSSPSGGSGSGGVRGLGTQGIGSRWLNQPGDKIMVTGRVERVNKVYHEKRWYPRHLYIIRTPDGDAVKWLPSKFVGFAEGDEVTLRGEVKEHLSFRGEKQTEMHYCSPEVNYSPSRPWLKEA